MTSPRGRAAGLMKLLTTHRADKASNVSSQIKCVVGPMESWQRNG